MALPGQSTPATDLGIEVRLAADPDRRGPPALVWLREDVLPDLPSLSSVDTLTSLALHLDADGVRRTTATTLPAPDPDVLIWRARVGGLGTIDGRCSFDGMARVELTPVGPAPRPLRRLVEFSNLDHHDDPIVLDVATAVGLLSSTAEGDPLAARLTMAAAECGELTVAVRRDGDRIRLIARSRGGLLLPASLAALAAAGDGDDTAIDRWLWLAHSARDDEREEATRQLSILDDPAAAATLRSLLHADDAGVRAAAMAGLIRSRATEALPDLLSAADPALVLSEPLAEAAVWNLLPDAGAADRERLLHSLHEHPSARMRSLAARITAGATASRGAKGHRLSWPSALIGGLSLTSVLLCVTLLMRILGRERSRLDQPD